MSERDFLSACGVLPSMRKSTRSSSSISPCAREKSPNRSSAARRACAAVIPRSISSRVLVEGRPFFETDRANAPLVVILNRTAAQQLWPGQSAIGKRLTSANPLGPTTVVGIVEDVRLGGPSEPAPPTFYVPFAQLSEEAWSWARSLFLVARADGDPAAIGGPVRRVLSNIDPGIPLFSMMTMEQRMASTVETARFNTMLLGMLGVAGLLLAAVGIYGVIGYFAAERTLGIGIRMALGASRLDVVRLVVGHAAIPVLGGVALGALGALFASRAIASS